jgi:hypothetical protein
VSKKRKRILMDHSKLDLFIKHDGLLGRPTIELAFDTYSRKILSVTIRAPEAPVPSDKPGPTE